MAPSEFGRGHQPALTRRAAREASSFASFGAVGPELSESRNRTKTNEFVGIGGRMRGAGDASSKRVLGPFGVGMR